MGCTQRRLDEVVGGRGGIGELVGDWNLERGVRAVEQ